MLLALEQIGCYQTLGRRSSYNILFLGLWLMGQSWVPGEGSYPEPSISVHPNEAVALGGTVNIRCKSDEQRPPEGIRLLFYLQKQKFSDFEMWRNAVAEHDEVEFPIVNATPSDAGLYRCIYCFQEHSCLGWSYYSNYVNISVRAAEPFQHKSSTSEELPVPEKPSSGVPNPHVVSAIIWTGVLLLVLLLLLLLAFILYRRKRGESPGSTISKRTQPLPMKETNLSTVPEAEDEAEDDPDEVSYAVLNQYSLKRQEAAKVDSIPDSCVYASVANG